MTPVTTGIDATAQRLIEGVVPDIRRQVARPQGRNQSEGRG